MRDAIFATRSLGFRYIWIDTLCLNQDDDMEKLDQITKMHIFYSHAVMNLSAAAAGGGGEGMIRDRYPFFFAPLTIPFATTGNDSPRYAPVSVTFFKDERRECIDDARIYSRGWVFQERMLARRVLHFASDQVYWECHALDVCDTVPSAKDMGGFERYHEKKALSVQSASFPAWQLWQDLIASYTRTNVTFAGDKLVALSALAQQFGDVFAMTPQEYGAGVWNRHLPMALCWEARDPSSRPATYRAPTWSWASIQSAADYSGCDDNVGSEVKVENASVTMKNGMNPFGEVTNGRLHLRGRVFKNLYLRGDSLGDVSNRSLEFTSTASQTDPSQRQRVATVVTWDVESWAAGHFGGPEDCQPFFLLSICCGETFQKEYEHAGRDREMEPFVGKTCLVLRQTSQKGQFTREGIILSSSWALDVGEHRPPLINKLEYAGEALGGGDYLESHDDGSYTVEIA